MKNCTLIGHYAGFDLKEPLEGTVIIGDEIRSLDPEKNHDTLFIGDRVAIGKFVGGVRCNLYDILVENTVLNKKEKVMCDKCELEATHIGEPDPFQSEMNDNNEPCNLCDSCYKDSLIDI